MTHDKAHKILEVDTYTVSSTHQEISIKFLNNPDKRSSDHVKFVFDGFTSGSVQLVQTSSDTEGRIYNSTTSGQVETEAWQLGAGPRYLYTSGSNSYVVRVTSILVR